MGTPPVSEKTMSAAAFCSGDISEKHIPTGMVFQMCSGRRRRNEKGEISHDYSCCQGSSSLKYQLINMEDESVIAKGNCDRIGIDGHLSHKTASGVKVEKDCDFPTHAEAFSCLVEALTTGEGAVISSMDEISAVGHRVVQGAEVFTKTTLVTDEIIEKIDELRELAPRSRTGTVGLPQDPAERAAGRCIRHRIPPDHSAEGIHVRFPV